MAFETWMNYETPFVIDSRADFAWFSNEDIALTATLATGVNDTHEFALPYPSSVDLFEETIVLYKQDWIMGLEALTDIDATEIVRQFAVECSMLQIEHITTSYQGSFTDAEDESLKSKFAGPFGFGMFSFVKSDAGDISSALINQNVNIMQYMPFGRGLDLISPLYNVIINKAFSVAATAVLAAADNTSVEAVADRIWHRKRNLTSAERSFRNIALRFMLIDT